MMAGNLPAFAYTCIHDYGLFTGKGYGLKNQPEEEMHRTELGMVLKVTLLWYSGHFTLLAYVCLEAHLGVQGFYWGSLM